LTISAKIYNSVTAIPVDDWRWQPYFSPKEMACSHCGKVAVEPRFMDKLLAARILADFPFIVTSGYRCPEFDAQIGGKGPHTTGEAVDIALRGEQAQVAIRIFLEAGFMGLGVKQSGADRFIHIDTLDEGRFPDHPRPWVWSYR